MPITLSRLEVKNARVNFVDPVRQPKVEVGMRNLHAVATDLQNRPKENGDALPSRVEATGLNTGDGKLRISLRLDLLAR